MERERFVVHGLRGGSWREWREVERLSFGEFDVVYPLPMPPISVPVGRYRTLTLKLLGGENFSVQVSQSDIDQIAVLLAGSAHGQVSYLDEYRASLKLLPLSAVMAAFWSHFGDVPTSDISKQELIDAIIQKIAADHES